MRDENSTRAERGRPRGRPRRWASTAARVQAAGARRQERNRLLGELLHAVRNARWDEPALQRTINDGDDATVLEALTQYYRRRHWMHYPGPGKEGSGA